MRHYNYTIKTLIVILIIIITSSLSYFIITRSSDTNNDYIFSKLYEGDFIKSLTTSGVINPKQVISVGTQVSGIVEKVNVEENSPVKEGQIIASLDKRLFINEVNKDKAILDQISGRIDLIKIRVDRLNKLIKNHFASEDSLNEMQIQLKIEEANYALAKSDLDKAILELSYTDITSPIDGIILEKLVEPGQTVAASFSTPVLFKIARNLSDMEITTKISEEDIPLVMIGQKATFTVDSFPHKVFEASVDKIKIDPNLQQGVVTYDVLLKTENLNGILRPGMTANIEIILQKIKNARYVLTDALRFASRNNVNTSNQKEIDVFENNKIVTIPVQIGIENEQYTQILKGDITPNEKIIIGIKSNEPN